MATLIPAAVEIPKTGLYNGGLTNDDGHGFAIASAKLGMETFRSMTYNDTFDALVDARQRHGSSSVVLFHSRWATHGEYGPFNIHPFAVGEETVMAHNGVLPGQYHPVKGDRRSDTRIFVDRVAANYCDNPNGVPSRRGSKALGRLIGSSNKLVFLSVKSGKPMVRIVNSHLGTSEDGVWYSNTGFMRGSSLWGRDWKTDRNSVGYGSLSDYYAELDREEAETAQWVRDVRAGRISTAEVDELICDMCGGDEIDEIGNYCMACDFCLDCQAYFDECMCYVPDKATDMARFRGEPECEDEDVRIVNIEDTSGQYVKADGIWRFAESLFPAPLALPAKKKKIESVKLTTDALG